MEENIIWILVAIGTVAGIGVTAWNKAYMWAKKTGNDKWVVRLEKIRAAYLKVKPVYQWIMKKLGK